MGNKRDLEACYLSLRGKWLLLPFVIFLLLLDFPHPAGEVALSSPKLGQTTANLSTMPANYGEVIYKSNDNSPNQIFIIGMSHRDSLTCLNGENTSRVQAEAYQIGDWLIHNQNLELLLPEGFFASKTEKMGKENIKASERKRSCGELDFEMLEERLSDNKTYVNAEMLLNEYHPLRMRQLEDEELYDAVRDGLLKLVNCREGPSHYAIMKSEMDYLQERRIAAMLQKIPVIVEAEFRQGNIKSRKAIFTIGMSHLYNIIRYQSEKRIRIVAPLAASNGSEDYFAGLNLLRENFGVSIILPKTLRNDQNILKINRLDKVIAQSRK